MIDGFLNESVAILREASESSSDSGYVSNHYALYLQGVPFSIQQRSEMFHQTDQGETLTASYSGFCRSGVDIKEGDLVNRSTGEQFIVRSVNPILTSHIEVLLERREGEPVQPDVAEGPPPPPPPIDG